jgi:hypothetical protein
MNRRRGRGTYLASGIRKKQYRVDRPALAPQNNPDLGPQFCYISKRREALQIEGKGRRTQARGDNILGTMIPQIMFMI